jgi:fatty acid desaturase (delta-4 desaturase)
VLQGFHFTKMSKLLEPNKLFEASTVLFFLFRWLVLPILIKPSIFTLLNVLPIFIVGGYYLAFFFVISHNFDGVMMFDQKSVKATAFEQSFLRLQVATSSNVGGAWLCFLNGGLNYQIEHHLFPRVQHTHYPTIAPLVQQFCKARGIPYRHFPTIGANVRACVKHLFALGSVASPVSFMTNQAQ